MVEVNPYAARVMYTFTIILLVLALFALPFNIGNEAGLIIDLVVIVMLTSFLTYLIYAIKKSS